MQCVICSIASHDCSDVDITMCGNHSQCTQLDGNASCTCDKGYKWEQNQCEGRVYLVYLYHYTYSLHMFYDCSCHERVTEWLNSLDLNFSFPVFVLF